MTLTTYQDPTRREDLKGGGKKYGKNETKRNKRKSGSKKAGKNI